MTEAPLVLVFAGGEGRRIGGGKPLRRLAGQSLVARAVALARRWSDEVRIAVRRGGQVGEAGAERLADDPEIEGPLGGLGAGLRCARELGRPLLLTLPCDAPFLPADLCKRLADEIGASGVAVAASGGELHPVCALWRAETLDLLPGYLASGGRSLRGFAEAVGHVVVAWDAAPEDPFFNINSEADLAEAERRLGP